MSSKQLGEMFEGDSTDMHGVKILLVSMGNWVEGFSCADQGARTPIDAIGIFSYFFFIISWSYAKPSRGLLDLDFVR